MTAHQNDDLAAALVLDGNAIAGELQMIFGSEMTGNDAECGSCGQVHARWERSWPSPVDPA